jgi:creatinine amidohydrolase
MGVYSDRLESEVRLERMRPDEVSAAIQANPSIYVPFGSVEWHGIQNPVGLDSIKAHEQLVGLAAQVGGIVYPSVFFGSGGGHTEWPHSYMVYAEPMINIVTSLLHNFERDGFQNAILISGHYPNKHVYLDTAKNAYMEHGGRMRVLTLIENQIPDGQGDHAALIETSFMLYLHPELVDLSRLGPPDTSEKSDTDESHNWMGEIYRNHPLYGLVGIDPRGRASAELGKKLTEALITYLAGWLKGNDEI